MLRQVLIMAGVSAASILALSAYGQDMSTKMDKDKHAEARYRSARPDSLNGACKSSDIIGMTVNNYQGEKLGNVEDLAVDVESGRIVQVVLSTGGFIGIGDTLSAVPPSALFHDVIHKDIHLDANKEKLKNAPKFEMSKWADCCTSARVSEVYTYYGEEPAFRFVNRGDAILIGRRNADGSLQTVSYQEANGTREYRLSTDTQTLIPEARLVQAQRCSKVVGTTVKNLQGEKLGKVENLLVDMPSGRVVAVVVSTGGFLGMGDELSAVPPTALRCNTEKDALLLDTTKEKLSNAPHFKSGQWPEFSHPAYVTTVYRAYNVEPYFPSDVKADNTGRNVRDRDTNSVTPMDQGNTKADLDTTAQIRKEILAGDNMSLNAKNVKIITVDGKVTLRGPVDTHEEKRLIGDIAIRIARVQNVDNQLEVK